MPLVGIEHTQNRVAPSQGVPVSNWVKRRLDTRRNHSGGGSIILLIELGVTGLAPAKHEARDSKSLGFGCSPILLNGSGYRICTDDVSMYGF